MSLTEIWGHRGAYHFAPENTLTGFQMACDMGADGIELDIQLTRDGQIVVIHDETIDRTGNGTGYVKDFSLKEIKKFNFNKRGITSPRFMEIPTLSEVFDLMRATRLEINVEFKTGIIFYDEIEKKALALAEKYDVLDKVVWSSFNHYSVGKVKQLEPEARTALLCGGSVLVTCEQCEKINVDALHLEARQLRYPKLTKDCQSRGIKVRAWAANEPGSLRTALEESVNAVITNRIDIARELRRTHLKSEES